MIKTDNRLLEIYVGWEDKLNKDEWYFSNSFDSITKGITSQEAYKCIPNIIEVLLSLEDDYLIWETLYFLIEIYSIADTTEIHPQLESNFSLLTQHIKKYNDSYTTPFKELMEHLRIKE